MSTPNSTGWDWVISTSILLYVWRTYCTCTHCIKNTLYLYTLYEEHTVHVHTVWRTHCTCTHSTCTHCMKNTLYMYTLYEEHTVLVHTVWKTHSTCTHCMKNTLYIYTLYEEHTVHVNTVWRNYYAYWSALYEETIMFIGSHWTGKKIKSIFFAWLQRERDIEVPLSTPPATPKTGGGNLGNKAMRGNLLMCGGMTQKLPNLSGYYKINISSKISINF